MVRARAGFYPHQARPETFEEPKNLRAPQLAANDDPPLRVDAVNLEYTLRQIEADDDRLVHGWLPSAECFAAPTLAHRDAAGGAIHTINGGQRLAPDRQTAEIHIRVALINRFNALDTADIVRVA